MQLKVFFMLPQTGAFLFRRSQGFCPSIASKIPQESRSYLQAKAMPETKTFAPPPSTPKTKHLPVEVKFPTTAGYSNVPTLDGMEDVLTVVGSSMGLYVSHITHLSYKRYPSGDNRHWHLKRDPKEKGCLDITYWIATTDTTTTTTNQESQPSPVLWVSIRTSEPAWVHELGHAIVPALASHFQTK